MMKRLWHLLPTLPFFVVLFIASLFADPWYLVWLVAGGIILGVAFICAFILLCISLSEIAEKKAKR